MKRPIIVFDFDKTLTNHDTIFGFYAAVHDVNFTFEIKRILLVIAALLYKIGIIKNDKLKQFGVKLFLKGISKKRIEEKASEYANNIPLNPIYNQHYLNTPKKSRIIISASFEVYLQKIFPDEKIIGSTLAFKHGNVVGVKRNMFGEKKKWMLLDEGIKEIDCLYTDSYSDLPLMEISKKIMLVKDGVIAKIFNKNLVEE